MKKMLFALMILLALTIVLSAALADGPVNPRWEHVQEMLKRKQAAEPTVSGTRSSGVSVSLECVSEPTLDDPGEFRAVITGGDPADYVAEFAISDEGRDPYGYLYCGQATDNLTFDYVQLYCTGEYSVMVNVYSADDPNLYVGGDWYYFTLTGPESASMEYKAAQIVAECRGTDDWHTALNLHDWLTHHAYYDYNYEYYGADIMYRGYGVCDSYSKAYKMLCQTAGITVDRVISSQLWHAWNALVLDGKWYQVDVTWDDGDPYEQKVAVSGWEGYDYFCLNDELMGLDHHCTDATFTMPCTSLDANYFIHENQWGVFGVTRLLNDEGYWIPDEYGNYEHDMMLDFVSAVNSGETEITLSWDVYYYADGECWYYMGDRQFILYAYGLGTVEWTANGVPVDGSATHAMGTESVTLIISEPSFPFSGAWGGVSWTLEESGLLTITGPGEMADFSAGSTDAWKRWADSIVEAVLEDGVESIGSYAFADCVNLETVTIPDDVVGIESYAFDSCGQLDTVFYKGTRTQWNAVDISTEGNASLLNAQVILYDETETLLLPANLTVIGSWAFAGTAANAVVIPLGVTTIAADAFDGSGISVIYGFEGSAAEAFANAHEDILFIPIDDDWLASH